MNIPVKITFAACFVMLTACGNKGTEEENQNPESSLNQPSENQETEALITTESPEFSWNEEGVNAPISLNAWVDDPDEKSPTNVRNSPGGKVVLKLEHDDSFMVTIIGQRDGWFEITDVVSFNSELDLPHESMWIHPSVLAASTRNYDPNQKLEVYRHPEANPEFITDQLVGETYIRLSEYYYDFVHIQYEVEGIKKDGWIKAELICGNPVTTCP